MKRLRWGLGGALVAASLLSAARALFAYAGHGLWLGSASVLLLAAIAIVGYLSLWQARQRIERELAGLGAAPPRGELMARRRSELEALRARGVQPDREALAAASEAEERGRAYLGRYFVAVTVLVGLVGTFAGLMETLRTIGPLLSDGTTLQLLQAPLAGLDVTFGASVVGILVTLALALVQGDLVLAEELALTRLEERTTHVLVPELWPPAQAAEERTAGELAALRKDVERLGERAGDRAAAQLAEVTRAAMEKLVADVGRGIAMLQEAIAGSTRQHTDALTTSSATHLAAFTRTAEAQLEALTRTAQAHVEAIAGSTRQHADVLTTSSATHMEAFTRTAETQLEALTRTAQKHTDVLTTSSATHMETYSRTAETQLAALMRSTRAHEEMLAQTARRHGDAIAQASEATAVVLRGSLTEAGARLEATSQSLARAVEDMRGTSETLAPLLAGLGPELNAMAREVALLAARADGGEDPLIADELVRLGEGVDRVESLLRMAQA